MLAVTGIWACDSAIVRGAPRLRLGSARAMADAAGPRSRAAGRWRKAILKAKLLVIFQSVASRTFIGTSVAKVRLSVAEQRRELAAAFESLDSSGDGELDLDELRILLHSLGNPYTDAEIRDKVRAIDTDGNAGAIRWPAPPCSVHIIL